MGVLFFCTAKAIVQIDQLSSNSGTHYLVKAINWTINPGEHWLVFGMNGCGKTTLLSMIAGYKDYSAGDMRLFGEVYTTKNILTLRKRIGWVSSSFLISI